MLGLKGFPQLGNRIRFGRAGEAKLCERVGETTLSTLGLRMANSPAPLSPPLISIGFLHGFFGFEQILPVICMGFIQPPLRGIVFRMGFIELRLWHIVSCMGFIDFPFLFLFLFLFFFSSSSLSFSFSFSSSFSFSFFSSLSLPRNLLIARRVVL